MSDNGLLVFSGNANPELARRICSHLDISLGVANVGHFSDGETRVEIVSNVRGRDVFVIQPTCNPANEHLMELLVMIDALRRASAQRITAVIPFYGYARQERKSNPRTPITAKLVAALLERTGTDRILTLELHTGAVQGFFDIPMDHLLSKFVLSRSVSDLGLENPLVVSPDAGGVDRARSIAQQLGCGLAIVDKRRDQPGHSEVMNVIGDVAGKACILVDDIIDTAGTMTNAAEALMKKGASRVITAATHAVLSGPAVERIAASSIDAVIVTDTIPLRKSAAECAKFRVVSVAELLGKAIRRIHHAESISTLFV